eukprot:3872033-Rhodomonas_salina.1
MLILLSMLVLTTMRAGQFYSPSAEGTPRSQQKRREESGISSDAEKEREESGGSVAAERGGGAAAACGNGEGGGGVGGRDESLGGDVVEEKGGKEEEKGGKEEGTGATDPLGAGGLLILFFVLWGVGAVEWWVLTSCWLGADSVQCSVGHCAVWNVGHGAMQCLTLCYAVLDVVLWNVGRRAMECLTLCYAVLDVVLWNVGRRAMECWAVECRVLTSGARLSGVPGKNMIEAKIVGKDDRRDSSAAQSQGTSYLHRKRLSFSGTYMFGIALFARGRLIQDKQQIVGKPSAAQSPSSAVSRETVRFCSRRDDSAAGITSQRQQLLCERVAKERQQQQHQNGWRRRCCRLTAACPSMPTDTVRYCSGTAFLSTHWRTLHGSQCKLTHAGCAAMRTHSCWMRAEAVGGRERSSGGCRQIRTGRRCASTSRPRYGPAPRTRSRIHAVIRSLARLLACSLV